MKIKIWKEGITESEPNQMYLKLDYANGEDIMLSACDMDGNYIEKGAHILYIDSNYRVVVTLDGINPAIPLKTDLEDQVLIYEETEIHNLEKGRFMQIASKDMLRQIKEKIAEVEQPDPIPQTH
jgi:hypothetical protein